MSFFKSKKVEPKKIKYQIDESGLIKFKPKASTKKVPIVKKNAQGTQLLHLVSQQEADAIKAQVKRLEQAKNRASELHQQLKLQNKIVQQEQQKFQKISKKLLQAGKMQQNEQKWNFLNEIDTLLQSETCPNEFDDRWETLITSLLQAYLESGFTGREIIGQILYDILNKCRRENPQKYKIMKDMIENVLQGSLNSKSDQLYQSILNQVFSH